MNYKLWHLVDVRLFRQLQQSRAVNNTYTADSISNNDRNNVLPIWQSFNLFSLNKNIPKFCSSPSPSGYCSSHLR